MGNIDQDIAPLIENKDQPLDLKIDIPEDVLELASECCIYKVPRHFREANKDAYTPQLISIGPLHRGKENLVRMEGTKQRYFKKFLNRIPDHEIMINQFVSFIKEHEKRICMCYDAQFVFGLEPSEFVKMILYDSVFIIELFLRQLEMDHYEDQDFLIRRALVRVELPMDLMLLENQIPFFVLEGLYLLAFANSNMPCFLDLACSYFHVSKEPLADYKQIKHFTDLIRCNLVRIHPSVAIERMDDMGNENVYSATRLHEAGIQFKGIEFQDAKFKANVIFQNGVLEFPILRVAYETEICFRNLMAFEQCHYPNKAYFCSYIQLLSSLAHTYKDVDLLIKKGIIVNRLGNNATVANMINNLAGEVVYSSSIYRRTVKELNMFYGNSWPRRIAIFRRSLFRNVLIGSMTVVSLIMTLLTLVQTIFVILDRAMPTK